MAYIVYFDSGTTNSRAYLLRHGKLVASAAKKVGTIDNVMQQENVLLKGLKVLYEELCERAKIEDGEVQAIYMSGMVTSKQGIKETPYVPLPITAEQYRARLYSYHAPLFGREILLMPGLISKRPEEAEDQIALINNVRGEETELFGLMAEHPHYFNQKICAVLMPGSHTHILFTNNHQIVDICSCMGGELYAALAQNTILRASVSERPSCVESEFVKKGYQNTVLYGINRALYITRAMHLFSQCTVQERDSYIEGVVNAGIITALQCNPFFLKLNHILVMGSGVYYDIFDALCKQAGIEAPCELVKSEESFSVCGIRSLMEREKGESNDH